MFWIFMSGLMCSICSLAIGTLYVMKDIRDKKLVLPIYVILGFCGLCIMLLYTMAIQGRVNV